MIIARTTISAILSGNEWHQFHGMSSYIFGCSSRFYKECGLLFYRFPSDIGQRNQWAAAINRKNWEPTEYSRICSSHFVGGQKSNDPTSHAHVPSLFRPYEHSKKRKAEESLARYVRSKEMKKS